MLTSRSRRQRTTSVPFRPLWLRALTIFALLLVTVGSTVQVCHAHGELLSLSQADRLQAPHPATAPNPAQPSHPGQTSPEDHCPLCVAMHSALPAGMHIAPEPLVQIECINSVAADAERVFRWRFELLSRPPPLLG